MVGRYFMSDQLIEPQKAVFYFHPETDEHHGEVLVSEKGACPGFSTGAHSLGAVMAGWKRLTDDEAYHAMNFVAMEISELWGISMADLRDEMEKVRGYKEHSDKWGRMAMTGKPT